MLSALFVHNTQCAHHSTTPPSHHPAPPSIRWLFNIEALGPPHVRITLCEKLADIENRLAYGTNERLQLGSLVAAFSLVRDDIVAAAQ